MPRSVHFGADQVRRFYKSEPSASAASDPIPDALTQPENAASLSAVMTPIRKPAPTRLHFEPSPVVLESVDYAHKALYGSIKVHNLAFEKHIFVRTTKDDWETIEDIPAVFQRSITGADGSCPGLDRFCFTIPAAVVDSAFHVSMCVCYKVDGQEFWDSNQGANYLFKISPAAATALPAAVITSTSSDNDLGCDAIKTCSKPSEFSYGFASSVEQTPQKVLSEIPSISNADARRYMQYSEAKFSFVAPPNRAVYSSCMSKLQTELAFMYEGLPLFQALQWSSNYTQSGDFYSATSPLRTSSPIMCTGSPLATSHSWASCPATLLHC
ncbi:hypothetical protein H4S00_002169 [Coemansia sp. D1744]|nr:hypothetical protein H4S00_002169 [Coemansia sp. D1744]